MKKLLLALVLLTGSVLPSMAHRCQEKDLEYYIYINDLECVKYLVDLIGMDRINEDPQLSANLFLDILFRSNFKVFSFMIDNGLTDKHIEYEIAKQILSLFGKTRVIK